VDHPTAAAQAQDQGHDVLTRDEARARAALVTSPAYTIALDLDRGDETFGCEATVRFRAAVPGASTFIDFTAAEVRSATLNGRPLAPDAVRRGRFLLADLAAENTLHVVARCAYSHTGSGMHHFRDPADGLVYCYTDFEPREAHRVYPCFDQPDIKGTFEFAVKARPGWRVIANAVATAVPPAGAGGVHRFARTRVLPTYVTAVCAGPYHGVAARHRAIDLGVHCRQSLARHLDADEICEITRQGFDFFTELFAYPYAFGKYDQVFVPEYNSGAMENAGCITFHESMIFRSKVTAAAREDRALTILHELAHMWFGDLVTMRWWDDLWLNESFATYMGQLALVRATRFTNAWVTFAKTLKPWAYRQDQLPTTHPIVADVPDTESARSNFDGISYAKGASVLKQLVAWVGEEAFRDGVRAYFRRYEFGNAELVDFLAALAAASGRDLDAWARTWLAVPGVNTLRGALELAPGDDEIAALAIEQTAPAEWPTLRPHRIGIGLYDRAGGVFARRRRLLVDIDGPRTPVPALAGEQAPDLLLVNDDDLTFAKIRLDERSRRTVRAHLAALDDPLARTLCWTAVWDEMRDAVIPARDYVRLVLDNIAGENDIGVVESLLANALAAIEVFGAPARRRAARAEFAQAALAALRAAAPGGDFQLAWARGFIATAESAEQIELVRALLAGTASVPGLAMDTDLRWYCVLFLAAGGAAGADLIAAERARDATDVGERRALAALAARPDPEAKAEAWAGIVGEGSGSFAHMRARMSGFMQSGQAELVAPYIEPYFAALPGMWSARTSEVAIGFARSMYPRVAMSEELVTRTADFLAAAAPPAAIRRALIEAADEVARALRARALDGGAGDAP
jgi:aminopeptidase N